MTPTTTPAARKMPPPGSGGWGGCTICNHPERDLINGDLARGDMRTHIATRYALSPSSLARHARRHLDLDKLVSKAERAATPLDVVETQQALAALAGRLQAHLDAPAARTPANTASLARELRSVLEAVDRLQSSKPFGQVWVREVLDGLAAGVLTAVVADFVAETLPPALHAPGRALFAGMLAAADTGGRADTSAWHAARDAYELDLDRRAAMSARPLLTSPAVLEGAVVDGAEGPQ